jgi:hypothetical protein
MDDRDSTGWTLLRDAAAGGDVPRAEFVSRYAPVVRSYLGARWRNSTLIQDLDDTMQDVVSFHHPGPPGEVDRECEHLLSLFEISAPSATW